STLFSAANLRAAGSAIGSTAAAFEAAFAAGFAASAIGPDAPARGLASVSIVAITSLLPTVAPSGLAICVRTPDSGAGSSSTTLSVSISIRFSSRFTYSPAFLCQVNSVASETDSDSCGTLTSTSMVSPVAAQAIGSNAVGQCGIDHRLLLFVMQRQIANRRRGRGGAQR